MAVISFKTRARTVDHLGREQIADTPTAISELWKNAFDAYATSVGLHIFDSVPPTEVKDSESIRVRESVGCVAAVVDNGHGMSREEFVGRWLVLGTESKLDDIETPENDRNGQALRIRQGQKGIGRLSIARLGPLTLVLTKRRETPLTLALVDWRLFENPYLNLEDILIPVETLAAPSEDNLDLAFRVMLDALFDNVSATCGEPSRNKRINDAWERFDAPFIAKGATSPSERLADAVARSWITSRHLEVWDVWRGESEHGTALFVLDVDEELAVWTYPADSAEETPRTVIESKELLQSTLTRFVDLFSSHRDFDFDYQVAVHRGAHTKLIVGEDHRDFSREDFYELEHFIEGRFDEHGTFTGNIRAFGGALTPLLVTPQVPPPAKGRGYVGPLEVLVGTFEQDPKNTTHPPSKHRHLLEQARHYSGLALYRDDLRIMPYGRPDADLFALEERRSRHTGREFWADRRTFGRIAFSRAENPHLHDKAGREGLIDNRARREMRRLVIDLLRYCASKYFGSDSENRRELLPEIRARNLAAIESGKKAQRRRLTAFRAAVRGQLDRLTASLELLEALGPKLAHATRTGASDALLEIGPEFEEIRRAISELKLPLKPARLPPTLEKDYRTYRDAYRTLRDRGRPLYSLYQSERAARSRKSPEEVARSLFGSQQHQLHAAIETRRDATMKLLRAESERWQEIASEDRRSYHLKAAPFLSEVAEGTYELPVVAATLIDVREQLEEEIVGRWDEYIRALESLAAGIEIDNALRYSTDLQGELEERVRQVEALAQLGIAVEIIGHELNDIEAEIGRSMKQLPHAARTTPAYKDVLAAQRRLFEQLRFLAPMLLSGRRPRETLTGDAIFTYTRDFFARPLSARSIDFSASQEFLALRLVEHRSRILPVFLNLVNNALYWVCTPKSSAERQIRLAVIDGAILVADSGPGIDPDDLPRLFQIFFTRRSEGRGIGLYLCRNNLALGNHTIEYVEDSERHVLSGAHFLIRLRGASFG